MPHVPMPSCLWFIFVVVMVVIGEFFVCFYFSFLRQHIILQPRPVWSSLYSPSWPQTFANLPASASQVLELQKSQTAWSCEENEIEEAISPPAGRRGSCSIPGAEALAAQNIFTLEQTGKLSP